MRIRTGLVVLYALIAAGSLRGDVVWKVEDAGPIAPPIVEVVGDDTRVLATGTGGTWELDGKSWHVVTLDSSAAGAAVTPRFTAGGRFFTTTLSDGGLRVFALRENAWTLFAEVPSAAGWTVRSDERIYVPSQTFNSCDPVPICDPASDARRLRSVSLSDGTVRDEPPLPACSGKLFVLSGRPHVIDFSISCAEPGADRRSATSTGSTAHPLYRLDGDRWTALPPWDLPTSGLRSTPNSLWSLTSADGIHVSARVLTSAGLSDAIAIPDVLCLSADLLTFHEWNGRLLVSTGRRNGDVHELRGGSLVPLSPASPVTTAESRSLFVGVAGRRLFTSARGWDVHVLDADEWLPTSGIESGPGAEAYLKGETKTFATRGTRVFRRDEAGWTRLAPLPSSERAKVEAVWRDRPVASFSTGASGLRFFAHSAATDSWDDLRVPAGFGSPMLATGEALYVGGPPGQIARLRDGAWMVLSVSPLPGSPEGRTAAIRQVGGSVFATTRCSCSPTDSRREPVYRVDGDRLVTAFTELDTRIVVRDLLEVDGRLRLRVQDGRSWDALRSELLSSPAEGYGTLLVGGDLDRPGAPGSGDGGTAALGDTIFFGGLAFSRGQVRAGRGPSWPTWIDRQGRYGFFSPCRAEWSDCPLLVPARRVRKSIAAVVDATGHGGVRYRSTLTLANLSSNRNAVARLYPGSATVPAKEIPLGPGAGRRLEDPLPGFVGPLAVGFEGLSDEREAWTAVRVWNSSGNGTAGTSILGTDPGSVPYEALVLPPVRDADDRLHLALAAGTDGPGLGLKVPDLREPTIGGQHPYAVIPDGAFLQIDPRPEFVDGPLLQPARPPDRTSALALDDLLGYLVRNDATTNDGTVVPFEPPDAIAGRRTRFLPTVVGTSSEHADYRTELTLSWVALDHLPGTGREFTLTYRDENGSKTFRVAIEAAPLGYLLPSRGRLVEIPDAGAWLVENGVPIDPSSFAGTLTFSSERPEGAADLLVTAVVQARHRDSKGAYGVSVPVVNEVQWATERAVVPGLREDGSFRSNVALANPEALGGPDVTLEVTLHQASDGSVIGALPAVTLAPGRRIQLNRPLGEIGYGGDAWAEVRRVGGTGRFVAYGVVNDNATSDGTLLPMAGQR